ncbi:hypothetical protein X980_6184 [Burkholderia pseudomallei MSHR4000]|nr:hypothetical protein X980_6184 [Burkholderia pseudomallei MSHR4000]
MAAIFIEHMRAERANLLSQSAKFVIELYACIERYHHFTHRNKQMPIIIIIFKGRSILHRLLTVSILCVVCMRVITTIGCHSYLQRTSTPTFIRMPIDPAS